MLTLTLIDIITKLVSLSSDNQSEKCPGRGRAGVNVWIPWNSVYRVVLLCYGCVPSQNLKRRAPPLNVRTMPDIYPLTHRLQVAVCVSVFCV